MIEEGRKVEAVLTFQGLIPDVYQLSAQWVVGGGEPSLEAEPQGRSWREAIGEGVVFSFPAEVGRGVGASPPATGTSEQKGEPNYGNMQGG